MSDKMIGAWAMVLYIYNTSGVKFVQDVYGIVHPTYEEEKMKAWGQSPATAMGFLDQEHREKLLSIAVERWGDVSREALS